MLQLKYFIRKVFAPVVFLGLFLAKFSKFFLILFKLGKFSSLLTMVISVGVYSMVYGLPFAAGFVLLLFIHELGHALMLRRLGIAAGLPVFIPFVGAYISMRELPRDAWKEALVGISGPILGSVGAFFVLLAAWQMKSPMLFALAQTGFVLNLFNMLPVSPMDGGRIVAGVSRIFLFLGYGLGIYVYTQTGLPLLLVMLVLGFFQLYQTVRFPIPGYFEISWPKKIVMGLSYLSVCVVLFAAYRATVQVLGPSQSQDVAQMAGCFFLVDLFTSILSKNSKPRLLRD